MNLALFTPEISLVGFAVLVILLDLFVQRKGWLAVVSIVGTAGLRRLCPQSVG